MLQCKYSNQSLLLDSANSLSWVYSSLKSGYFLHYSGDDHIKTTMWFNIDFSFSYGFLFSFNFQCLSLWYCNMNPMDKEMCHGTVEFWVWSPSHDRWWWGGRAWNPHQPSAQANGRPAAEGRSSSTAWSQLLFHLWPPEQVRIWVSHCLAHNTNLKIYC